MSAANHKEPEASSPIFTARNVIIAFTICVIGLLFFGFKDAGTASTAGLFGGTGRAYECGSIFSPKSYKGNVLDFSDSAGKVNDECSSKRNSSLAFVIIFGIGVLGLGWLLRMMHENGAFDIEEKVSKK